MVGVNMRNDQFVNKEMFSCILSGKKSKGKFKLPFKVWDHERNKRFGLVTNSLKDLECTVREIFELSPSAVLRLVLEEDGCEVDEDAVLQALAPHTVIMALVGGQAWSPGPDPRPPEPPEARVERALTALLASDHRRDTARRIHAALREAGDPQLRELLGQLVASMEQNIDAESRDDDPGWFSDLPASKKTKSVVMRDCAKRRVRKYYNTALDSAKSSLKRPLPEKLEDTFDHLHAELTANSYHGDYFDRSSPPTTDRMCDGDGWFRCEGAYDAETCLFADHQINPYGSKANYLVFSTWNLDHQIEKSREVVPCLLKAVANLPKKKNINWMYFYELLFTRKNLKLVHTSCHDKSEHESKKCDPKRFYVS